MQLKAYQISALVVELQPPRILKIGKAFSVTVRSLLSTLPCLNDTQVRPLALPILESIDFPYHFVCDRVRLWLGCVPSNRQQGLCLSMAFASRTARC